ncbi:MAG: FecR domain-containing protein [Pseudomonadota bacterium]
MRSDAAQQNQRDLEMRALELLDAARGTDDQAAEAAVDAFGAQSPDHAAALATARQLTETTAQLPPALASGEDASGLRLELWWARALERPAIGVGATAALLALVLALVLQQEPGVSSAPEQPAIAETQAPETATYVTAWGQQQEITLSEGSTLWLGWDTRLTVTLTGDARQLTLEAGKAAFRVTPDATRPFTVKAGSARTRVTGTEFVVRKQSQGRVEVAVLEGSVAVAGERGRVALEAAQVVVATDGVLGEITARDPEEIGRWRTGMLVFRDRPVLEALEELASYTPYRLNTNLVGDHSGRVTGVFFLDQAQEALVTTMESHRLQARTTPDNELRLQHALPTRPVRP